MSIGLIGKKIGMTRIFNEEGEAVAVTVIDVSDNVFLQRKTTETDGYSAVQVAYDEQKEARLNQPEAGHFAKSGASAKKRVMEFRLDSDDEVPVDVDHPGIDLFEEGQWVDVIGTSKGLGFQGAMRRYGFSGQPMAHGHMMHRRTGSVGPGTTPGRVWKNKKMPGRHGNYRKTVQNLKVVQKRDEDNVLLISGAVPGAKGGYVIIRPAVKKEKPVQDLKALAAAKAEAEEEAKKAQASATEDKATDATEEVDAAAEAPEAGKSEE